MKEGFVKWFDTKKGYGFIVGNNGQDIFVHQSDILMNGYRFLDVGQHVSYFVEETQKGRKAVNVVVKKG